jgi:GNAT superfamily N-acetyltransferase
MPHLEIRRAGQAEVDIITGFQLAMALETENIHLNKNTITQGVQAVFDDSSKGCYYVALDGSEVVACMLTTYEWSDWRNGTFIWLQSVYVQPAWRGKGIFRAMYQHIKKMVDEHDGLKGIRLYVFHTNQHARAVYNNIGMSDQHYRMFEWVKD